MSEQERMLVKLGEVLAQIARPHRVDELIPVELQATLSKIGVSCSELSPRDEVIAQLWARKRSLLMAMQPDWGGPGVKPPHAA